MPNRSNIYLVIEENELEYTTEEHTPELVFNVTDPNGNKVENITGLLHYENGFDITTRTGGFLIASDYVIEANNAVTNQVWNISIEFVNLDSNQNANLDKNFSAKIYMTPDKISSYNPIRITNIEASPTYNTVDTTLSLTNGTAPAEKYYFGIEEADTTTGYINNNNGVVRLSNTLASADTVEYIETDNPNYEFTNLKENTEYMIYSYVEDINGIKSNIYETRITTNEYVLPSITEVTHSVTLNSITLTVNASGGDGNVVTYMYSKDNGASWETSTSNTYTFNNLSDTTEYKIKVKTVDSNGKESPEYYEAISTETYILPNVVNVRHEKTYNSITITPSGTNGTGTIDHYLYSIDNGAYQTSNVFSGLAENTTYTIKIKAIDNNNRESNPYTLQITTNIYQVPVISSVSTTSTATSITINVSATNGDGTITKYMYSRDNGSNWYESTSNSYTFDNLTSNTTFYFQVKVVDNNGRESSVYSDNVKTQYISPVVNSISVSEVTATSVTLTVNASAGSDSITTYYYSKDNGSSYVSSNSNTYTFTGLSGSTTYNFKVYVVDNSGVKSDEATVSETTLVSSLAGYVISLYTSQGSNGVYYHTSSLANSAADNSYRFTGADPNNYVCFGTDESVCPEDNIYRIIGAFNVNGEYQVKLIKNASLGRNYWHTSSKIGYFPWSDSTLNNNIINGSFLTGLGEWANLISTHTWKVGGGPLTNLLYGPLSIAPTAYSYEVGANSSSTTYTAKIGLMYISDYYYAAPQTYWTYPGYTMGTTYPDANGNYGEDYDYRATVGSNWLYIGTDQWTITPSTNSTAACAYKAGATGAVDYKSIRTIADTRPVFYLNSDIQYSGGSGTIDNPIRISEN